MGSRLSEVSQRWVGQPRGRLGGLGVLLGLLLAGLVSCKARDEPVKREEPVKPAPSIAASAACPHYGGPQQITIPSGNGTDLAPPRVCISPGTTVTLTNRCATAVLVRVNGPVTHVPDNPFTLQPGVSQDIMFGAILDSPYLDVITVDGCSGTDKTPKTGTVEVGTDPGPK